MGRRGKKRGNKDQEAFRASRRYRELVRIEYRPYSTADPSPGKKKTGESLAEARRGERALYRVRNVGRGSQVGDTKFL